MTSDAASVDAYLAELPPDRREAIAAVRAVILANKDADVEEGMQYGMIGYYIPHRVFPAGYHCDPKQPLPYAGLASQKGHMSLYLMPLYASAGAAEGPGELARWFQEAWAKSGKKLDMGKSCIRFKRLDDLPLDVVGELFRRMTAAGWLHTYTSTMAPAKAKPARKAKGATR